MFSPFDVYKGKSNLISANKNEGRWNMSIEVTFHILGAIGSIMAGIIMLITFIRVVRQLKLKDEVIYGEEATKRYKEINNTISENGIKFESIYEGGNNKIIPRLEVEKIHFNPILMKHILKGYKIRVRYFYKDKDNNDIRHVTTWYLKSNL
jgi:hypothetical protein